MASSEENAKRQTRDFAYWKDLAFEAFGAISLLGGIGHFVDWWTGRKPIDADIALGFLTAYCLLFLIASKRFNYIFYSLLAICAWGFLGAIASRSLLGLPLLLPAAFLVYMLLRWKGHLLK